MERVGNSCTLQTEQASEILTSNKHNCFQKSTQSPRPREQAHNEAEEKSSALRQELPELSKREGIRLNESLASLGTG